jgi:EamA-like transporter family protein
VLTISDLRLCLVAESVLRIPSVHCGRSGALDAPETTRPRPSKIVPAVLLATRAVLGGLRAPVWLALLVLAVVGAVLPYLAGLGALRNLRSALASVLALVEPLVAAVLAWLLLGQALGLTQLAGAVILLTGAVLVQLAGPNRSRSSSGARIQLTDRPRQRQSLGL